MLNRTRVAGSMDVQRLASAVQRPGIDTRCWVSLAVATADSVVDSTQGKEGVFVDVKLMPSEEKLTARVAPAYAGSGFGIYARVLADDEVVVAVPNGVTAQGPVVINRLWSAADKPPDLAGQNEGDLVIVVESGKNLRIQVAGAGNVEMTFGDEGKLIVGNEDDQPVLESKNQGELTRIRDDINALADALAKHRHPLERYFTPLIPNPGKPIDVLIKNAVVYGPPGVAIDIIEGAQAKEANAPMDEDADVGEFIGPDIPPNIHRQSGLFPDATDPNPTNSERQTLDK